MTPQTTTELPLEKQLLNFVSEHDVRLFVSCVERLSTFSLFVDDDLVKNDATFS